MRAPTSWMSIDQHVDQVEHLGSRLARLAVEREDRHVAPRVLGVRASRSCCPGGRSWKPCCGPKIAASVQSGEAPRRSTTWREVVVDRGRIGEDADPQAR